MRFLKIILSVFALFYRLTPNYLIISDVYFLHREIIPHPPETMAGWWCGVFCLGIL